MLCFVFSALVVVLDQLFKRYITITMALYEQKTLIPGLIGITYVQNPNAALSIYIGGRWVLAAIMFVCVIILIAILLRYNEGFWGTLGLAAVLGGAVGNFIDRVFIGEVVDMFEFQFMNFAVFNIADIFITLGGLTFLIFFIVTSFKSAGKKEDTLNAAHTDAYAEEDGQTDVDYLSDYDYDSDDAGDYDYAGSGYADAGDADSGNRYDDADIDSVDVQIPGPKPYLRPMAPVDQESIRQTRHALSPFETDTPPFTAEDLFSAAGAERGKQETPGGIKAPSGSSAGPLLTPERLRDASVLLEELEALESDLSGADSYDDDVDKLLREYGFEDDESGGDEFDEYVADKVYGNDSVTDYVSNFGDDHEDSERSSGDYGDYEDDESSGGDYDDYEDGESGGGDYDDYEDDERGGGYGDDYEDSERGGDIDEEETL